MSRSSLRSPSPAPARSARRRGGSNASSRRPARRISPPPVPVRPAADAARCSASGTRRRRSRRAQAPARRPIRASPCAISALAANRPPIPPPTIATRGAGCAMICSLLAVRLNTRRGVVSSHRIEGIVAMKRGATRANESGGIACVHADFSSSPCRGVLAAGRCLVRIRRRSGAAQDYPDRTGEDHRAVSRRRNRRCRSAACWRIGSRANGASRSSSRTAPGPRETSARNSPIARRPTATRCCRRRRRRW